MGDLNKTEDNLASEQCPLSSVISYQLPKKYSNIISYIL